MKVKTVNFNYSDFDIVKNIALTFPETEEGISHEGTLYVKVRGKLLCRLHGSGEFIPIRLDFEIRDKYLDSHPEIFHLPDHFKAYPYVCLWIHNYFKELAILLRRFLSFLGKKPIQISLRIWLFLKNWLYYLHNYRCPKQHPCSGI